MPEPLRKTKKGNNKKTYDMHGKYSAKSIRIQAAFQEVRIAQAQTHVNKIEIKSGSCKKSC